jgi:hypothetical protein
MASTTHSSFFRARFAVPRPTVVPPSTHPGGVICSSVSVWWQNPEKRLQMSKDVVLTAGSPDIRVMCSGWMSKQGHMMKNWKERYFVLLSEGEHGVKQRRASLMYYKRHWKIGDTHEPQGSIPLHGASHTYGNPLPGSPPSKVKYYEFDVSTVWNNRYPIRVRGEREREMWALQIRAAISGEPVSCSYDEL